MNLSEKAQLKPHKVHKYERVNLSADKTKPYYVYKCRLPNCPHYIPEALVWGRASICWRCGDEFIVENPKLRRVVKLYCNDCRHKHHLAKPEKDKDPALDGLLAALRIKPDV